MKKINSKYRDSVFRSFFNEPTRLLSLCNAVLETNYSDTTKLEINTLEGIFFDRQKNDISCTIDNHFLLLIEHQSTVNNNMPFRFLCYVTELLNNLIKNKRKLYQENLLFFPTPKFFVLYNGNKEEPVKKIMRLSDAFHGGSDSLELSVTAFNINNDVNQPLLDKCSYLNDYSTLVGKVKEGVNKGLSHHEAISNAIKFCLTNGIMGNYLLEHSEEVFNMLALEWNMNDALQARFDDGIEKGIEKGLKQGSENIALKLIHMGLSFTDIQKATELPLQRIQELAKISSKP